MALTLIQNDFCEFPWPSNMSWNFESVEYGDTKTLVLSPRGSTLKGMMVQVWNLAGNDLKSVYAMQWSRLSAAPRGFPPGTNIERIETTGDYREWVGVSNLIRRDRFVDYELMSKNDDTVIYFRRSSAEPDTLNIQKEISMIRVSSPDKWVVGNLLERKTLDQGR